MNLSPFYTKKRVISNISLLHKRFTIAPNSISGGRIRFRNRYILTLLLLCFTFAGYAQKNKDILPLVCVKKIDDGLYQATFSYENPTNKEVIIDENGSIIKSNNGKKIAKGLNKFQPGLNKKTFTKEFGPHDFVTWTITSNGKTHEVVANINSAYCEADDSFIEPVIGNGKSDLLYGNEIEALCLDAVGTNPSELIFRSKSDNGILKVLIEIIPKKDAMLTVLGILQVTLGVQNNDFLVDPTVHDYSSFSSIDVFLDKPTICELVNFADYINFARPVYPTYNNSGGVLSQGDAAQTSDKVKEAYRTIDGGPIDGTGVTIRVLSDSYDMLIPGGSEAEVGVANKELPDDLKVIKESPVKATDEGRAMSEIIHDVAPGASIQFSSAMSPNDFIAGVDTSTFDCDIIVDDITFITEPFFESGSGRVAKAIINSGKLHYTSAGNLANKAYQSIFNPTATMPNTNFIDPASSTVAHDFDTSSNTDYLQKISVVPGTYLIALQYKNDAASQYNDLGADDDLDIYIVDDLGRLLVGSNRVNVDGDPTEVIVFRATGTGEANILIASANGPTNVPFRYIAFRTSADDGTPDGLKFEEFFGSGAPTITGHAMKSKNSLNVLTTVVGAVDFRNADAPVAEYFSSYGGLLPDGTNLETDLYAPDGTSTSFFGQYSSDPDAPPKFYGTSASAPHAAAAMALLQSALPAWYPLTDDQLAADSTLKTSYTNAQALATFTSTTTEFSVTPPPGSSGGLLNAFEAFKSIASQSPNTTELVVLNGAIPSAEPFTVMIIGEFFPDNVEDVTVTLDGQPLDSVAYSTHEGVRVVTAWVPIFTGNPVMQVVAKSITDGDDGKGGETSTFFPDGKIALNIIANDTNPFEYGQDISSYYRPDTSQPDYIPSYTVEGLPDGQTFESLGLPPIVLVNSLLDSQLAGDGYPIVADYVITPSFGDEVLTPEQLDNYQINFISGYNDDVLGKHGYLTITKKDLTITPHPLDQPENTPFIYTYGDAIDLTLHYSYDVTGIFDNSQDVGFYSVIDASHQSDYKDGLPNKFKAVVSKFKAVVSAETIEYNLLELLNGGSWTASDRTIQNKFKAVVSTMNIIDLDNDDFTNYIEARNDYDDGTTNKFKAVVSKFKAVVSAEDLFSGAIDLSIDNKFKAVVSKFKAVVSTDDPDDPERYSSYESVFSIIDADDGPPLENEDGYPDPERAISDMYALNMITGLEVTPEGENHFVYPGAFLNATSANFNITYVPGSLIVLPKELTFSTSNLVIPYGTELTKDDLETSFDGWAFEGEFQESEAIVFPMAEGGIPYYFVKVGDPDETPIEIDALKDLGDYLIKVSYPQNYFTTSTVVAGTFGTVTIEAAPLTFTPITETIMYGESFDITPDFIGFADGEDATVLEVDGKMPYYFMKNGDAITVYYIGDKMDVGVYEIFNTDDLEDNYIFLPDTKLGNLTITEAPLQFNPGALELEYGVTPEFDIAPITGFVNGETPAVLNNEANIIPYYFKKEGDATTVYNIGDKMSVGIHEMFVTDDPNDNYSIENVEGRGKLTVIALHVTVQTSNLERVYGEALIQADLSTNFSEFAYGETVEEVFGSSVVPYYLEDTDGEYEINAIVNVGIYDIRIRETNANYIFDFDSSFNVFEVTRKSLTAIIDNLVINQGEIPVFTSVITGFIPGDNETNVYSGVPYYIVDEYGYEAGYDEVGPFKIKIRDDRKNYSISSNDATLFINPFNDYLKKIRIYSDCVTYDPSATDGLPYTVVFRYENDNFDPIFVPNGPLNKVSGPGADGSYGELPNLFMPGAGTFIYRFNGRKFVWSLTTFGSTNKTSVSSSSTSESGECDAKLDGAYTVYPNPVTEDKLFIKQNVLEVSTVYILNMYGGILDTNNDFNETNDTITIDMSGYDGGIYVVRIVSPDQVRTYNIIKQ